MKKVLVAVMFVMLMAFNANAFQFNFPTYPDMTNRDACTYEIVYVLEPNNLCQVVEAVQKHMAQKREAARLALVYYSGNPNAEANSETGASLLKLMVMDYLKLPLLPGSDPANISVKNALMGGTSWPLEMETHALWEMKMIFYRLNGNRCDIGTEPTVAALFRGAIEKWFSIIIEGPVRNPPAVTLPHTGE